MVYVSELRVVLPMTAEEFRRAQRYANWKTNEYNTEEGQGGQLLSSTPYFHETWGAGFYTHSLYRLGDRLPDWVTRLIPSNALVIDEKTWMTYPYCRSVLTIPFFKKLKIEMLTMHLDDNGSTENVHGLNEDQLRLRKLDFVDISADKVAKRDYIAELDPAIFKSKKTGRGPLCNGWQKAVTPVMCAYKLVTVEANYWGFQSRAEKLMLHGVRQIVLLTHRNAFCYMDNWFDLTYEEICTMEVRGRGMLKVAGKLPPIVDVVAGEEVIAGSGSVELSTVIIDDTDESSIELEFFEAEMDWRTQEDEEYVAESINGSQLPDLLNQDSDVPDRCAVCVARGNSAEAPQILCKTCDEHFCNSCFAYLHVTPRLKSHVIYHLVAPGEEPKKDVELLSWAQSETPIGSKAVNLLNTSAYLIDDVEKLGEKLKLVEQGEMSGDVGNASADGTKLPILSKGVSKGGARPLNICPENLNSHKSWTIGAPSQSLRQPQGDACELSEQMVRCISTLYIHYAESMPSFPVSPVKRRRWRRSTSEGPTADTQVESKVRADEGSNDPYNTRNEHCLWNVDVYLNTRELSAVPTEDKLKDSCAFYKKYRILVTQLANVNPSEMTHEQRLAFWINVYNSLMMHSYIVFGMPKSHYKRITMMNKAAYVVGGHNFSALAIEHAILRANSYRPVLASFLPVHRYKRNDERVLFALDRPEPLVSFGLCCGSRSSPMVRAYSAENVMEELQVACQEFLVAALAVNSKSRQIYVPTILHWYARDFSHDARSLLDWISQQLPEVKGTELKKCLDQEKRSRRMSIMSYDWGFRYLFDQTLDIRTPGARS